MEFQETLRIDKEYQKSLKLLYIGQRNENNNTENTDYQIIWHIKISTVSKHISTFIQQYQSNNGLCNFLRSYMCLLKLNFEVMYSTITYSFFSITLSRICCIFQRSFVMVNNFPSKHFDTRRRDNALIFQCNGRSLMEF